MVDNFDRWTYSGRNLNYTSDEDKLNDKLSSRQPLNRYTAAIGDWLRVVVVTLQ
jgi:hypothetical protein